MLLAVLVRMKVEREKESDAKKSEQTQSSNSRYLDSINRPSRRSRLASVLQEHTAFHNRQAIGVHAPAPALVEEKAPVGTDTSWPCPGEESMFLAGSGVAWRGGIFNSSTPAFPLAFASNFPLDSSDPGRKRILLVLTHQCASCCKPPLQIYSSPLARSLFCRSHHALPPELVGPCCHWRRGASVALVDAILRPLLRSRQRLRVNPQSLFRRQGRPACRQGCLSAGQLCQLCRGNVRCLAQGSQISAHLVADILQESVSGHVLFPVIPDSPHHPTEWWSSLACPGCAGWILGRH